MLRKLGAVGLGIVVFVGVFGSNASASTLPRTAVVVGEDPHLLGVTTVATGQAVESDADGSGGTTWFTASCEVTQVVYRPVGVEWYRWEPLCWIRDLATGRRHDLTVVAWDFGTGVAAGLVDAPADHAFQFCVGYVDHLDNGTLGDEHTLGCAPVTAAA